MGMGVSTSATLIGGGLAMAQGYAGYKQASAQAEIDEAVRNYNNGEAISALTQSYRNVDEARTDLSEEAVGASIDSQVLSAKQKGAVSAEAGASGTGGGAVDMQFRDIEVASARNTARAVMNRERQEQQLAYQSMAALNQSKSRINLMPTQSPNKWVHALGAGASGFRNILAFDGLFTAAGEV